MATRSFLVVTLFATLFGIGMAELVRPSLHRDLSDSRTSMLGLCLKSGIGCGIAAPGPVSNL
ncbi:hypothetical protein C3941_10805 [Kaistia algarum]|uniref:hypothetical protein n=1 Tax=Kaistia algarum TaxID=2083279 RepID=UPI000CE82CFF|nr:hypothetical protein [Kaistia algarum]MCX5514838.1 hypothetical protein [Kaistia algarum]PPE79594.1 hypothetical protein C3941_10805 [Kaistia algarum]